MLYRQRDLPVWHAVGAERDAGGNRQLINRAIRLNHQHRRLPGRGRRHLASRCADYQIAAADQLPRQVSDDVLQDIHQLPRRHACSSQSIGRRTQPAHEGDSLKTAAHHLADHHPGVPRP